MANNKRVLIVEDDPVLRKVIARNLAAHGCEVIEAETTAQAIAHLAEPLDVTLLDINLPDQSGWNVMREMNRRGVDIPTIVISAVRVSPERLREFHPLAYLPKPFPLDALLRLIEGSEQPDARQVGARTDGDPPARYQAELALRSACRTLAATSPKVVSAFTVSLGKGEYEDTPAEWKAMARILSEQYKLRIDVLMTRDHLRIRVSRKEAA
ncbi:MAG TPA: response regulator [Dehalococcoidia bacterium]|nr:response regulator [Dehalococcoidia bacterium]